MQCTALCSTWSCLLAWGDRHAEAIIALAAVVVAVWTARVLLQQAGIAREESDRARVHDRKSVSPKVLWTRDWKQGMVPAPNAPQALVAVEGHYELKMANYGLGPAGVSSLAIRFDDQVVAAFPGQLRVRIFGEIVDLHGGVTRYKAWDTPAPLWLSKDTAIEIIDIDFMVPTTADCDAVFAHLKRYSFEAKYESIYGDAGEMDSRKPITFP